MADEKVYKSIPERIRILESRNMTINQKSIVHRRVLEDYSYYNIVNGYKQIFLEHEKSDTVEEKYKSGTTPDQLFYLYKFDEKIRLILLEYVLQIEEKIKNAIPHAFYEYYLDPTLTTISQMDKDALHKDSEYFKAKYYDTTTPAKTNIQRKFVEISSNTLNRQYSNGNGSIIRYKDMHGYTPMWVLFNVLTFGNISKLFSILPKDVKLKTMNKLNITAATFQLEDETVEHFEKTLEILAMFRNVCAHNERTYCFKHNLSLRDRYMNIGSKLPDQSTYSNVPQMKYSIYSVIVLMTLFLSKRDVNKIKGSISKEFENLEKKLTVIDIDDVKKVMYMDHEWERLI